MRTVRLIGVALLAFVCTAQVVFAQPQSGEVSFGTPTLFPSFSPSVHDYVVRCHNRGIDLSVHSSSGWEAAVNNQTFRGGDFSAHVPLGSGKAFRVTFRETGQSQPYNYFTRCLPDEFPAYTFRRLAPSAPRYFSVDPWVRPSHYVAIFDAHGVPVWWLRTRAFATRVLLSGKLLWYANGAWGLHRLDGSLVRTFRAVGMNANSHDIRLLPNRNHLTGSYVLRPHADLSAYGGPSDAPVLDTELQEVTRHGQLVWAWKSQNHISLNETAPRFRWHQNSQGNYDIVHWNSIEPASDNAVIASFRYLDAIYKISKETGNIIWKLGGSPTPQSLSVVGDPATQPFGGQHDARVLPDGTISVFDNRFDLNQPPRVTRWRIDNQLGTATLVQAFSDPTVPSSQCCGSARYLPNGQWLVGWGDNRTIGGYKPNGSPTFRLKFGWGHYTYRAEPVPEKSGLSSQDFRQAMNAMCSSGCN